MSVKNALHIILPLIVPTCSPVINTIVDEILTK